MRLHPVNIHLSARHFRTAGEITVPIKWNPTTSICYRNTPFFEDTMFSTNRLFRERNPATGSMDWFFMAREGTMGPYASRKIAETALAEFKERCMRLGSTGGRSQIEREVTTAKRLRLVLAGKLVTLNIPSSV